MLKIRLQRTGRKHEPTFRVVLTDSKNGPKSGKFLEILGNYDPRRNEQIQLKKERIQHWIAQGAKPSDTVHNLLVKQQIIKGEMINVLPKKSPIVKEGTVESQKDTNKEQEVKDQTEPSLSEEVVQTEEKPTETPVEEKVEEIKEEEKKEEVPVEETTEEKTEDIVAEIKEEEKSEEK